MLNYQKKNMNSFVETSKSNYVLGNSQDEASGTSPIKFGKDQNVNLPEDQEDASKTNHELRTSQERVLAR